MLRSKGESTKLPQTAYGQQLIWDGPKNGIQGVTELITCERTGRVAVQRYRKSSDRRLSASTHAFLHGQPTFVPGSWQGGHAACGVQASCAKNVTSVAQSRHDRDRSTFSTRIPRGDLDLRYHGEIPLEP